MERAISPNISINTFLIIVDRKSSVIVHWYLFLSLSKPSFLKLSIQSKTTYFRCWAHGAISALADRIKIARQGQGHDINLAIQWVLNCGKDKAGSCHGGYHTGVYELIQDYGYIPFDTCQPYLACSEESQEGFCQSIDTSCSAVNTCRTCSGFSDSGGDCVELDYFPNATVAGELLNRKGGWFASAHIFLYL